jgi:YHS domain-containing protein
MLEEDRDNNITSCPVCGMTVVANDSAIQCTYNGKKYYFDDIECKEEFDMDPEMYS